MAQHIIVLGHGEGDPGARGVNKTERQYLEDLGVELKKLIQLFSLDVELIDDINTYARNDFAKNPQRYRNAESVTDLHLNAYNKIASGAEILFGAGLKADNRDVRFFERLKARFGWRRWIISDYYQQTRNAKKYGIPSFRLVEFCFCDNPKDIGIYVKDIKDVAKDTLEAILDEELEEKIPITSESVLYRVQTGAFRIKKNAYDLEKRLQDDGYATYMIQVGSDAESRLYKVQIGAFAVLENAINLAKELTAKGYETFIVSTGDTDSVYIPVEERYTDEEMAQRVIAGHYGTGQTRIDNLRSKGYNPSKIQELVNDILINNQPVKKRDYLRLHSNVTSWRVYPTNKSRIPSNAIGSLNPSAYGGLEYEILEYRENNNVAIIKTSMFGKVQIWIGSDTKSIHSIVRK